VTAQAINGSAYPIDVEDLLPAAVDLALADDRVPSVNRLRTELKIGYDKARELHRQLTERAERWDATVTATAGPTDPDLPDEATVEDEPEPQATPVVVLPGPARTGGCVAAVPAGAAGVCGDLVGLGGTGRADGLR
jgi:hypothetical protein